MEEGGKPVAPFQAHCAPLGNQRPRSATRRHRSSNVNQSAIAGFAASGLFGSPMLVQRFPVRLWPTDNISIRERLNSLCRETLPLLRVHSAPMQDGGNPHKLLMFWRGQVANIENIDDLRLSGTNNLPFLFCRSVPSPLQDNGLTVERVNSRRFARAADDNSQKGNCEKTFHAEHPS